MPGIRVLLVEDDALNQALVRAMLARSEDPALRDARVIAAGSLAEARTELAGGGFDLVLLDAGLPDGSGLSLARELHERGGDQPVVIAVTGAPQEHRGAADAAGCAAVLGKPYSAAELRDLIAAVLLSAGRAGGRSA